MICPSPVGAVRDLRRSVLATVGGRPRTNTNETEKETGTRTPTAPFDTGLRKPMLYPLSYEGLRCPFAQHGGRVLVRRARAGGLVPDGLCHACAACRGQLLTTAPTRGADCTAGGVEPRAGGRASDGVTAWLLLAGVLVGSMGG